MPASAGADARVPQGLPDVADIELLDQNSMAHHKLPIQVQATRTAMIRLLQDGEEALAGYPVAPIIHGCWRPSGAGVSVQGCMLASCVLGAWLRHLDTELAELSRPFSGAAIARIRRQTREVRQVLAALLSCVSTLLDRSRGAETSELIGSSTQPAIRNSSALLADSAAPVSAQRLQLETADKA